MSTRLRRLVFGACAAVALAASARPALGAPPSSSPSVARPAPAVLLPVADDATVSFDLWFAVGSQDDPPGKEGLAWLTGQLIGEGGTVGHSYREIVAELYPLAAHYEVTVDREMTHLRGRAHRDAVEDFQELFVRAYTQPAFDAGDLERLRAEGLAALEKNLRYASDEELGKAALRGFVYEGSSYAHPPVGTVAGLRSLTLADVKAFYATHYTSDRLVIGLGGGYEPATLAALEDSRRLLIPNSSAPAAAEAHAPPFAGRRVLLVDKPGADASISLGYELDLARGDDDFYALWVANSWLGEHRNSSSHLYQVIREARGLNYGDYSYIEDFPGGGWRQMPPTGVAKRSQLFELWIRTLPDANAHFALRAAVRELEDLVAGGMSAEEFELTRAFLRKYSLHFADNTATRLGYALDDRFYGLDRPHLERFREAMDALTLEQVNAAIRRHLRASELKIVIVTGDAKALAKALTTDAPSPIHYDSPKPPEITAEDEQIARHPLRIGRKQVRVIGVDEIFER